MEEYPIDEETALDDADASKPPRRTGTVILRRADRSRQRVQDAPKKPPLAAVCGSRPCAPIDIPHVQRTRDGRHIHLVRPEEIRITDPSTGKVIPFGRRESRAEQTRQGPQRETATPQESAPTPTEQKSTSESQKWEYAERILTRAYSEEYKYALRYTKDPGNERRKWQAAILAELADILGLDPPDRYVVVSEFVEHFGLPELKKIAPRFITQTAKQLIWLARKMEELEIKRAFELLGMKEFIRQQIIAFLAGEQEREIKYTELSIRKILAKILGCPRDSIVIQQELKELLTAEEFASIVPLFLSKEIADMSNTPLKPMHPNYRQDTEYLNIDDI